MPFNVKGECRNTGKTHFKKGLTPWNKGKKGVYSEEHKRKIGEATRKRLLVNHPLKGKHHSAEAILKIKEASKNQSNRSGPHGKPWSEARREAQSLVVLKPRTTPVIRNGREYHPLWNEIRKIVYKRDKWLCQECEKHCGNNIACHHIDYDITNNDFSNLITLCRKCHAYTNFRREDWIIRYRKKENEFKTH